MKMTINLKYPIVISVQTNATKSRYVEAKTMTKLNSSFIIWLQPDTYKSHHAEAMIMNNFNHKSIVAVESNLS